VAETPGKSSVSFQDWSQADNIDVAELLRGLSSAEVQAVTRMTTDHTYARGACIFSVGDQQQGLYFVKKGLVS